MADPWERMALVGTVARPHGTRGQVVVNPETDFPAERFAPGAVLHLRATAGAVTLVVTGMRVQQGRPIVAFEGVDSIEDAERLRNAELRIPVEQLTPLPVGTYYRHDLIGCRVETVDGQHVGSVARLDGASECSWLVVRPASGREDEEVLVPLSERICARIEPSARRIVIDPPAGLLEVNLRGSAASPRRSERSRSS
jgi:16S rRNA processing protein RimM